MNVSEEFRKRMLQEVFEYNAIPMARPGDVTAYDVMADARARGRSITRTQAAKWLRAWGEREGWETELALVNGRKTRVWRKPAHKEDEEV